MFTLSTPINLHCPAPFERTSAAASISYRQSWRPKLVLPPASTATPAPQPTDWSGLAAALDALPLPAGLFNSEGGLVYGNAALQLLSGSASPGEPVSLRLEDAAHLSAAPGWRLRTRWTRLLDPGGGVLECLTLVLRLDEATGLTAQMFVETRAARGAQLPLPEDPAPTPNARARLTSRERQVLERLLTGISNKGVARDLGISPRTVEVHRGRILRKLGIQSLAQAGGLQLGLFP